MPLARPEFSELAAQVLPIEQKITTGHVADPLEDRTALCAYPATRFRKGRISRCKSTGR